jgi:hypothetical protein
MLKKMTERDDVSQKSHPALDPDIINPSC